MKYTKPRGTQDIYGSSLEKLEYFTSIIKDVTNKYKYNKIITPTFENSEIYSRNIGEDSDIVKKEFYTFKDKSDRELALRPEGTVGVIRAVVENNIINSQNINNNVKLYYLSNFFRYERPQKGRYREFFQFGLESISSHSYLSAIEVLKINTEILNKLQIEYEIKMNYIGNIEQRKKWMQDLNIFFSNNQDKLEKNSLARIEKNPLRILDDKSENKKKFILNAPKIDNFLNHEDLNYINKIKSQLELFDIKYTWDSNLIRGLDYYNGLVFEIVDLESKLTLVGGGYYSNLVSEVSDNKLDTICFGSGMGVERVLELSRIDNVNSRKKVFVSILDEIASKKAFLLRDKLFAFFDVEINLNFNDNFKKNMKKSDDYKSDYIIMIGQKEISNDIYLIKNKNTKETFKCKENEILDFLIRSQ